MTRAIRIEPQGKDWVIRSDPQPGSSPDQDLDAMIFNSGAAAEAAARLMADALAKTGETVQVLVYLRDGILAGRYDFGPGAAAPRFQPAFESA